MPDGETHVALGTLAGGAAGLGMASHHSIERLDAGAALILGGILGGQFGGRLPDILEPADHPNHRSVCHSFAAGRLVLSSLAGMEALTIPLVRVARMRRAQRKTLPSNHLDRTSLWLQEIALFLLAGAVAGFLAGYLSHLAADGLAQGEGLPMISRGVG